VGVEINKIDDWKPTRFEFFARFVPNSSTGVAEIKTDACEGFLKPIGNNEGLHALVREYVGTSVAKFLGLRTFSFNIMNVNKYDNIPLGHGCVALEGPAFISRRELGRSWSGQKDDLKLLVNTESITSLIVFDTLALNWDRYPPPEINRRPNYNNVFFSEKGAPPSRYFLTAIDHTHCLNAEKELNVKIKNISNVKDNRIYGAFPAFHPYISSRELDIVIGKLKKINSTVITEIINHVPKEWDISDTIRDAIGDFFIERSHFLVDNIYKMILPYAPKQGEFNF